MLPAGVRIFLCTEPQDMRRSFDALALVTQQLLGEDPQSGALFVFVGKRPTRAKVMWWDRNGYCILYNQPSSHYTSFDPKRGPSFLLCDVPRAARSLSRSQRLQCFIGPVAGSS
jgi:transposase